VELRDVRLSDPVVAPLLAALEQEYLTRYGAGDEMRWTTADEFDPPAGRFLVLLDDGITAAGGGFRYHSDGTCEVKRMWTHPDYRRRGLADRILTSLEEQAAHAGYRRLVLETGPRQPEAAAMYERRGYERIGVYGRYPEALAFGTDLDVDVDVDLDRVADRVGRDGRNSAVRDRG
jgi:GNAT superfamily N-acetyltransferase